MSVSITGPNKRIEFSVINYQFSLSKGMDEYDANWLSAKIDYYSNGVFETYTDACILSTELENLTNEIKSILNGDENGLITDFLEPYLKFSVTKVGNSHTVQIRFVRNAESRDEIYAVQEMSREEFCEFYNSFKKISDNFPKRNIA